MDPGSVRGLPTLLAFYDRALFGVLILTVEHDLITDPGHRRSGSGPVGIRLEWIGCWHTSAQNGEAEARDQLTPEELTTLTR